MERGVASENQGRTLDEIDIELNTWNETTSQEHENGMYLYLQIIRYSLYCLISFIY